MKGHHYRGAALVALFCLASPIAAQQRTWESADGRTLEAELLRWDDAKVTVRRSDNVVFDLALSLLSPRDQAYVGALLAEEKRRKGFAEGAYADAFDGEWRVYPAEKHGLIFQLYGTGELARSEKPVPLFVHLHGAAGRGERAEAGKVEIAAQRLAREEQFDRTPCVILVPLCPLNASWSEQVGPLEAIIDDLIANLPIDRDRVYLSGYSMGARGIGALMESRPDFYAAAMFADGETNPEWAHTITTSLWLWFSGERDLEKARMTAEAFRAAGRLAHFEGFPQLTHNQIHWKLAHDEEVFDWIFARRRSAGR